MKWFRDVSVGFTLVLLTFVAICGVNSNVNGQEFDSWKPVGPFGGDVRSIAIDPRNKNHLAISTLDAQVYSSLDGGLTWRLLTNFRRPQMVLDNLSFDARDSNVIYASGHRHKESGGFFKSSDGGATWKESAELTNEAVHAMAQSDVDPNTIVVGTVNGVWISRNSGDSFEKISSTSMPVNIDSLAVDPRNPNTIFAGTWWRAYKSTDAGKSWRLIKDGMIDDSDVFAIEIDSKKPDHIIASACSGIYESFNSGEKWAKIQGIPSQSRRTRAIFMNPSIPGSIYAGTTEGFWLSEDAGKSWSLTTPKVLEINSIAVHPDQPKKIYIATNNNGVMVSEDGGKNFVPMNGNFSSRFTIALVPDVERSNRIYAITQNTATGGGYLFVSDDNGQTWRASMKNLIEKRSSPTTILQDRTNPNLIYLGTNSGIFRSVDRGASWAPISSVITAPRRAAVAKRPVRKAAVKPAVPLVKFVRTLNERITALSRTEDGKNGLLIGTQSGLYRTYDPSRGYEKLNLGTGTVQPVYAVRMSPAEPNTIWAGTSTAGLLVSRDSGQHWEKSMGVASFVPIASIAIDPTNPQKIYVGTLQTFYLSHDGGTTWLRRGGTLPVGNYSSIIINPKNPTEIFAANALINGGGIFQSQDSGITWRRIDESVSSLPSRRFWSIMFDPSDPRLIFAGTHSSGVYRIQRNMNTGTGDQQRPRLTVSAN